MENITCFGQKSDWGTFNLLHLDCALLAWQCLPEGFYVFSLMCMWKSKGGILQVPCTDKKWQA